MSPGVTLDRRLEFATSQILSLNLDTKIIQALCEMGVDYPELSCGLLAQLTPDE